MSSIPRSRDLAGIQVLVTRPTAQAEGLCEGIRQSGGIPVRFPVIEIRFIAPDPAFSQSVQGLQPQDRVIFVSANAVSGLSRACRKLGLDLPRTSRIAAIGPATARALEQTGLPPTLIPQQGFTSEALLAMEDLHGVRGERIFIVRGTDGRSTLADTLSARGARVTYLETYRRERPQAPRTVVLEALERGEIDLLTATSGEALDNLCELTRTLSPKTMQRIPIVVGGHRVAGLARDRGFRHVITAPDPSDAAMLEAASHWSLNRPITD